MSTSFTVTRDQVIMLALRKLGVQDLGTTPDSASVQNASLNLNLLIKQMATEGLKMWKIQELVIPVTASKTTYTLGGAGSVLMYDSFDTNHTTPITDKPLKTIQAWYRNTTTTPNVDIPLQILSKQEYNILGSKASTGTPNSLFYDPRTTYGTMYLYLTPDTYTATNDQVHIVAQMPIQDINAATDIPDFPNEWMNCLIWNLADQMALEYTVPASMRQEIALRAKAYKDQLTDWDTEFASTFFVPDNRFGVKRNGNTL